MIFRILHIQEGEILDEQEPQCRVERGDTQPPLITDYGILYGVPIPNYYSGTAITSITTTEYGVQ